MVAIAYGFWRDYSKAGALGWTLTLPMEQGNLLLSAMTFLVTVAGTHCWGIVTFLLHHRRVKSSIDALDLQHRISLRNSSGAVSTLWEVIQVYLAWAPRRPRKLAWRSLSMALPALAVAAGFAVAAIFTSRVAINKAYGSAIVRVVPLHCGTTNVYVNDVVTDIRVANLGLEKLRRTALLARQYAENFYGSEPDQSVTSNFVRDALPYDKDTQAPCPIPAAERCSLGPNGAFSLTSAILDSHDMLGINTRFEDRVAVQLRTTCSPLNLDGLNKVTYDSDGNPSREVFYLGPYKLGNATYSYYGPQACLSLREYRLFGIRAPSVNPSELGLNVTFWEPIADLRRDDADLTMLFLSANDVQYPSPVKDPWFSANRRVKDTMFTTWLPPMYQADRLVSPLVCADQYRVCNPANNMNCTPFRGLWQTAIESTRDWKAMGFSDSQAFTVQRIYYASDVGIVDVITHLGQADALLAKRKVNTEIWSMDLPEDQWRIEVEAWFQVMLARLQRGVVEFSRKEVDTRWDEYLMSRNQSYVIEVPDEYKDQCWNQLVRTIGEVQNFSVVGVLIVVCVSLGLIVVNMTLESIVDFFSRLRDHGSARCTTCARQADSKLHLLRLALPGPMGEDVWTKGRFGVPVPREEADRSMAGTLRHNNDTELVSYAPEFLPVQQEVVKTGDGGEYGGGYALDKS